METNDQTITIEEAITDEVITQLLCAFPSTSDDFPRTVTIADLHKVSEMTGVPITKLIQEAESMIGKSKDKLNYRVK